MTPPKNVRAVDRNQGEARKTFPLSYPHRVIHKIPGRTRRARLGQDRNVVQEQAGCVRRDRSQKAIERWDIVEPPRISEAIPDDATARHQHSAPGTKEPDLLSVNLDPLGRQSMDTMLDGADGLGIVGDSVAPDGGLRRRGFRCLARPFGRSAHFLSLVQTRSMS